MPIKTKKYNYLLFKLANGQNWSLVSIKFGEGSASIHGKWDCAWGTVFLESSSAICIKSLKYILLLCPRNFNSRKLWYCTQSFNCKNIYQSVVCKQNYNSISRMTVGGLADILILVFFDVTWVTLNHYMIFGFIHQHHELGYCESSSKSIRAFERKCFWAYTFKNSDAGIWQILRVNTFHSEIKVLTGLGPYLEAVGKDGRPFGCWQNSALSSCRTEVLVLHWLSARATCGFTRLLSGPCIRSFPSSKPTTAHQSLFSCSKSFHLPFCFRQRKTLWF